MRNTLFFLSLAAGFAIACASSAGAVPISAAADVKEVAATTSPLQPAQYANSRKHFIHPPRLDQKAVTRHSVRTTIGQELKALYQVPQDLPREMLQLLLQLKEE
jgi:hypothetical protein